MQPKKVYVTEQNQVSIVCPHCGFVRQGTIKRTAPGNTVITARCSCGRTFPMILEFRRHYRKQTRLQGSFRFGTTGPDHRIMVKDLSLSGIGFITGDSCLVEEGRLLNLAFTLDDRQYSKVRKRAVARRTDGNFVGCEFVSHQYHHDKAIACYMMP